MVSSEVQRTLVKSPPELWAEISDPESLARHLGEFGEIRITRVHPEQRVEWETDDARGSVAIKPSGWGTKVKLTVTRDLPPAAEAATQPAVAGEPVSPIESEEAVAEAPVVLDDPVEEFAEEELPGEEDLAGSVLAAGAVGQATAEPAEDAELDLPSTEAQAPSELASELDEEPLREPRRGFFARMFGRRRSARHASREADVPASPGEPDEAAQDLLAGPDEEGETQSGVAETDEPTPAQPLPTSIAKLEDELLASLAPDALDAAPVGPVAPLAGSHAAEDALFEELHEHLAVTDEPLESAGAEPTDQPGPDVKAAEDAAAEQVTAVLTGVLDRLGAAHHRPFSRS